MKPPVKSIALMMAPPDDENSPDDTDGDDIPLSGGDHPTLFLPAVSGLPDYLTEGYEGDVTFHVKVTDSDDAGISFDLISMEANPPSKPSNAIDRGAMDKNFSDAESAAP